MNVSHPFRNSFPPVSLKHLPGKISVKSLTHTHTRLLSSSFLKLCYSLLSEQKEQWLPGLIYYCPSCLLHCHYIALIFLVSGHLHVLFPLCEMLFPQLSAWLALISYRLLLKSCFLSKSSLSMITKIVHPCLKNLSLDFFLITA